MSENPAITKTIARLKAGASVGRFFEKAKKPVWVRPLVEAGFFSSIPDVVPQEAGGIRFVAWPQAEYLARVANEADPLDVLAAVLKVPDSNNVIVYPNLLRALCTIPAATSRRAAKKVDRWMSRPFALRWAWEELANYVRELADAGYGKEALLLVRRALWVHEGRPARDVEVAGTTYTMPAEIVGDIEPWGYAQFLDRVIPVLASRMPGDALKTIASILDQGLITEFGEDAKTSGRDRSASWRAILAASDENAREHDYKSALVTNLVTLADSAAASSTPAEVVEALVAFGWPIHIRVAMHVSATHVDDTLSAARRFLLDRKYFDNPNYRADYSELSRRAFGRLEPADQDVILDWIDQGFSDEWDEEKHDWWRRNRLAPLSDALPVAWKERYQALIAKYGEADWQADRVFGPVSASFVGPTSPMTAAELAELDVSGVVAHLEEWRPTANWHSPSREGFGRILTSDVQRRPAEYAQIAQAFGDLHPTYARTLFFGMRQALEASSSFSLGALVPLAQRMAEGRVRDPSNEARSPLDLEDDPDWTYCRREVAHFLEAAATKDLLGVDEEQAVAKALALLLNDADPTEADEARYGTGMGWVNYSINCVRGQALHAASAFLGHLHRSERMASGEAQMVKQGIEVRALSDRSLAIRAALGMRFQQLVASDESWAAGLASLAFSDDEHGRVTWSSLVTFNSLHPSVVTLVWPVLKRALTSPEWVQGTDSLAQTLQLTIALFVWGYEAPEALLPLVRGGWQDLPPDKRSRVVISLGNLTSSVASQESAPVLRAAQVVDALIDDELSAEEAAKKVTRVKRSDLEAFGWVFATGRFPTTWWLDALGRLLALRVLPIDPERIVEMMATAFGEPQYQPIVLDRLATLAELDRDNWSIYAARASVAQILTAARVSDDPGVRKAGADIETRLLTASQFNPDWLKELPRNP